jgi:predicted dienelactone hydrolase
MMMDSIRAMNRLLLPALLLVFRYSVCSGAVPAAGKLSQPGEFAVEVVRYEWHDEKRDRKVPVKIYYPGTGEGPFPVIMFSHGLGGTRETYEYLGRHWASHGYVSIHVQHIGSDDSVWKGGPGGFMSRMQQSATSLANITNRPLDISFAIDQAEKLNAGDSPLAHRLDLKHIGMAGHSFGAYTTMAIIGEIFKTPRGEVTFRDPRASAAIAMSTPVPDRDAREEALFGSIRIPCLHMTGTLDKSPIGDTSPEQRRAPYDHIHLADQYLIIFEGGDHMIFSGRLQFFWGNRDEKFQKLVRATSLEFWDAYLKRDSAAKNWLNDGTCKEYLGKKAVYERKEQSAGAR